jgi:hypothetical protein
MKNHQEEFGGPDQSAVMTSIDPNDFAALARQRAFVVEIGHTMIADAFGLKGFMMQWNAGQPPGQQLTRVFEHEVEMGILGNQMMEQNPLASRVRRHQCTVGVSQRDELR